MPHKEELLLRGKVTEQAHNLETREIGLDLLSVSHWQSVMVNCLFYVEEQGKIPSKETHKH